MIKTYYKYTAIAVALLLWFFFVGPRMLSGPTETFVMWWVGTIFVIPPALAVLFKKTFLDTVKKDSE